MTVKTAFFLILLFLDAISASVMHVSCKSCLKYGGKLCLLNENFKYAACCDQNPNVKKNNFCKTIFPKYKYCATQESIKNEILRDFVCPINHQKCPHDFYLGLDNFQQQHRIHTWK